MTLLGYSKRPSGANPGFAERSQGGVALQIVRAVKESSWPRFGYCWKNRSRGERAEPLRRRVHESRLNLERTPPFSKGKGQRAMEKSRTELSDPS